MDWVRSMLDYNVPGGKLNRGLTVVHATRSLRESAAPAAPFTLRDEQRAMVLGWCIEWMQACFLVADDVMDASLTRRGQPCWYALPRVGMTAVNDSIILYACVETILRAHFLNHPDFGGAPAAGAASAARAAADPTMYLKLSDLFHETMKQTLLGQLADMTTSPVGVPTNLALFTRDRYHLIVRYKTAFYSFFLPVALALVVTGTDSASAMQAARRVCLRMGEFFQIQDDVLDCFGDPAVIGKVGSDIEDNKCSWLVVTALERASPAQRALLAENYGRHDAACVARVKALYAELDLQAAFRAFEDSSHAEILRDIESVRASGSMPPRVLNDLLAKIYKRKL